MHWSLLLSLVYSCFLSDCFLLIFVFEDSLHENIVVGLLLLGSRPSIRELTQDESVHAVLEEILDTVTADVSQTVDVLWLLSELVEHIDCGNGTEQTNYVHLHIIVSLLETQQGSERVKQVILYSR